MHHILAPARKPPVSALDLRVLFKNQAVSGNTNKKQNAERQEQTYKVAALGYLSEVCNVQRSSMNMWQHDIAGSFIDPRIQLGTGPVAEKLQHAEFRCSQERGLANPGLPMSFNICIDIPLSEKRNKTQTFWTPQLKNVLKIFHEKVWGKKEGSCSDEVILKWKNEGVGGFRVTR